MISAAMDHGHVHLNTVCMCMYVYTTRMYVCLHTCASMYNVYVCVRVHYVNICMLLQVNSSLAFFLFSFHVHEKSILLSVM